MRYELNDFEWTAIMLTNKLRGVRRVKRPSRAQRHLLGPAFRCTVARPTIVVSEELIEKAEEESGML